MTARRISFALLLSVLLALAAPQMMAQCVSLTTLGAASTQSFNTLSNTAGSTTNNLTITGWFLTETGSGTRDNEQYAVDTGGSNTGDTYSYGPAGNTDRALGGLQSGTLIPVIGACFTNNTGSTISSLDIAYTGEQWRIANTAAARDDRMDFQYSLDATSLTTGAWLDVNTLDFTNPVKTAGTAGALDGNAAANRTAISQSIASLSIANGATFWIRWNDLNASGADDGLAVDDFSLTPQGGGPPVPVLNISDVTLAEGNPPGTTTFTFAVTLTVPAGPGGVTFDIATADGTAQDDNPGTEDNDYVAQSLTGQSIPAGSTGPYNFAVTVNRDTTTEPNETFFVNVTNITGGNAGDAQGLGTINNDDVTLTPIHDVQGNGAASPLAGQTVTMRGIVTLLKSNGFFLQEELGDYDADPNTSEGVFVFTSSAPTVAVGDDASVTGTVVEFNELTEISPVTNVTVNSSGNTLPAAVTLTAVDLPPTAGPGQPQLEKYEGMRLLAPSLVTVTPNDSFFDVETVLPPQPRPFREPGIPASDPIPPDPTSGLPDPNIPIWDENPERLNVDTNGRAGSTGETLTSNVTLTNVAGPLDFAFGRYRLINEANLTRTADMSAVPVPVPAANEFTVAGYNIENFNNNATQRQKAALTIRDVLRLPDIIGTVEIFDLADLQALATEVQTISGVTYSAHLIEQDGTSEDSDQDVGFLVKTSRVSVTSVTAERASDTFINPNTGLPELLHDRPPLLLTGTVDPSGPSPQPVFVIVNHLRSFIDVELVAGEGPRVRAKRKAQAESLADLLNDLQTANPGIPVISVGDYNAFQFNSGYDDSISVLKGSPTPDDQIVVDQSPDLVDPNFTNLLENVPADQRYSFIFEGTPQSLDHVLVNAAAEAINTGIAVARVNADFPEVSAAVYASNPARPEANSDHDPVVSYFQLAAAADVSITKTLDTAGPYFEGQSVTYTINVANAGPDAATNIQVTDTPTNLSITSVSGACASLPCTISSLASGANTNITVTATITAAGAFDNAADADADEADPNTANNTDNTGNGGTAAASANVSVSKTLDTAGPYYAGQSVTYTITVANAGPSAATSISVTDTPANLTITSVSGACTSFSPCTIASLASGASTNITVTATIDAAGAFDNAASATAAENDPNTADNTDNTGNGGTAAASADVSVTKTLDTPSPYTNGQSVTYTIVVANAGPSAATNIDVTDTPANLTITSVSGACASFPCSIASLASGASTNITVTGTIGTSGQFQNTATANAAENDPDGSDNSSTATAAAGEAGEVTATKSVSGTFVPGTNITYTIVITNNMSVTQPNNFQHEFTDLLPAGLTYVSSTATSGTAALVVAPDTFAWNGSIPPGGTVTITITCTINANATGVISNQGQTIFDTDGDNSNDSSHLTDDPSTAAVDDPTSFTVVPAADLQLTKTDSPDPISAGSLLTYTITVTNAGPSEAQNVSVTDTIPAGTVYITSSAPSGWNCATPGVGGTGTLTCTRASFASGATAVITMSVTVNESLPNGTVITNTADVASTTTDPDSGNNSDTTTTTVQPVTNFTATKAVSGVFVSGTTVTYTVVLTNNMGHTQNNNFGNEFADILPSGLALTGASATSGTILTIPASNIVTWNGSIPNGGTVTITITATITAASGTISNQGNAIIDTDNSGNNETGLPTDDPSTAAPNDPTVFTVIPSGSVTATKSVSGTFAPGTNVTYTIVLSNGMGIAQGDNAGAELTDVLPPSLTLVSASATSGTAAANVGTNTVTWNGSLAAGASVTITITATINNAATGTVSNQADIDYDTDGNGSNEATGLSNDPNTAAPNDPTVFTIVGAGGDSDGDGVPDTVEQAAPNGGDGNGDGIPDHQQGTVASIPAATGSGYLTLQSSCALQEVYVVTEDDLPAGDHGFRYPHGLIAFRAPCSSATFSLFIYGSGAVSSYRKYGPLPPGGPAQWYQLPGATFQVVTVGSLHPRRVNFSLTDGGTGDDTPVDGVIVDQGGPADPDAAVPTASEWALLLMAAMLAVAAVVALRR